MDCTGVVRINTSTTGTVYQLREKKTLRNSENGETTYFKFNKIYSTKAVASKTGKSYDSK